MEEAEDRELIEKFKAQMTQRSLTPEIEAPPPLPYPGERSRGNASTNVTSDQPTYAWLDNLRINTKISMYQAVRAMKEADAEPHTETV